VFSFVCDHVDMLLFASAICLSGHVQHMTSDKVSLLSLSMLVLKRIAKNNDDVRLIYQRGKLVGLSSLTSSNTKH
jgi:hypothetical protein